MQDFFLIMAFRIFTSENYKLTEWSGGKTSQFWIHPLDSTLEARDFEFRISSAIVEVEESEFSNFEGYTRKLMVLQGELLLQHEGQHSILLKPFDQDTFDGSWKTRSKGKAQDFNLIYRKSIYAELDHFDVEKGSYLTVHAADSVFVFVFRGEGSVKGIPFKEGDLLQITEEQLISIQCDRDLKLIMVRLKNVDK